jgi:hypothetical protein
MALSRLLATLLFTTISLASDVPLIGGGYVSYPVQNVVTSGNQARLKRQDSVTIGDPNTGTSYVVNRN